MALDTLREDLAANLAQAKEILGNPLVSAHEVATHLLNTMWPTFENVVDELDEIDEGLESILNGEQDILQFETGKMFATFLANAVHLVAALRARLNSNDIQRIEMLKAIAVFDKLAVEVKETLELITVPEAGDEDEDEDEDGDEGDDDEVGDAAAPEGDAK